MTAAKPQKPLYLATKNAHKLEELSAMIGGDTWELRLATDLGADIGWDETGETFVDNARIKAMALRSRTGAAVLADDSGLEVDALDGRPGVRSSRYGGVDGDDARNNAKLLAELANVPDAERTARFVCCLVFITEDGTEHVFNGTCEGRILREARGRHGFGYDPLFQPEGKTGSLADLEPNEKNAISHRSRAVAKWRSAFG